MEGARQFQDYLKGQLKDEEFRKGFEEEGVCAQLAAQIVRIQGKKKLSQNRLAWLLHTNQQTVSHLEDPHNASYSLRTLIKLTHALGKELKVQFV